MHSFLASHQLYTALSLIYTGFFAAALIHLFLHLNKHCLLVFKLLTDIFLCAAIAFLVFASIAITGADTLRLYMLASLSAGFFMYQLGPKRLLMQIINRIKRKIRKHRE